MNGNQPTPERIMQLATGGWVAGILGAAASHSLFTHLEAGADTAGKLAAQAGISERGAQTLLDGLMGLGLVELRDGSFDLAKLQSIVNSIVAGAESQSGLQRVQSSFRANVPQYRIKPDSGACMMRGVSLQNFSDTLSMYEGSMYVNDFNLFGRTWQVIVQAEAPFRRAPESSPQFHRAPG